MSGLIHDLEFRGLTSRKLNQTTLEKFKYGVNGGRQVANYYDDKRTLVAQKVRGRDKTFCWTGEPKKAQLFGQQLWNPGGKQLVITEGEIDALSAAQALSPQCSWPVVSIPDGAQSAAKAIQKNLTFVESFDTIILAFDDDEPGKKAALECAQILRPGSVKIAQYPEGCKDSSDCLKQDVDLGAWLRFKSVEYRPDGIVQGKDLWDALVTFREGGTDRGYAVPWPELQEKIRGIRKKEVTTLTAGTGTGKSTFAHELGYYLMTEFGLKIGIAALEESKEIAGLRYMSLECNRRLQLDPEAVSFEEYQAAFEKTTGSGQLVLYDHFGSLESDALMEKLRYMAVGEECDFIILDHISIAVSGLEIDNERKALDVLMTNLRQLCENTGVGVIDICHLTKVAGGRAAHEDGGRISIRDLRGSGGIAQISDTIIAFERDQQDEDCPTQVRVLKCRWTGHTGPADQLKYNLETGRYTIYEDPDDNPFEAGENTDF